MVGLFVLQKSESKNILKKRHHIECVFEFKFLEKQKPLLKGIFYHRVF